MALSFSLRRDYRNGRQAERSYCTSGILLSIFTSHNSRLSQVSALNRVFEGVEGIDILQVSARTCPAHASMSQAISRFTFDGIARPICSNQLLVLTNFTANRSRFCFTRRHRPPARQRARSFVQARVPILRRRRRHRVSSTGKLCSRQSPPLYLSPAPCSVI